MDIDLMDGYANNRYMDVLFNYAVDILRLMSFIFFGVCQK